MNVELGFPDIGSARPEMGFSGSTNPALWGQGSKSTGVARMPSNVSVRSKYVNNPWNDNSHMHIEEGHLVFAARTMDNAELGMSTVVSLAKMNEILRTAFQTYKGMLDGGDANALDFARLLDEYGENRLERQHRDHKLRIAKEGDLERFYQKSQQPIFKYLTKLGISLAWNFLGAVVTTQRPTGADAANASQSEEHVNVLNVCVEQKATVHNVFGRRYDIPTASHACLVLHRVRDSSGAPQHFEFVPWASRTRLSPPRGLALYNDYPNALQRGQEVDPLRKGRLVSSLVIPVGLITAPPSRDGPPGLQQGAVGIGTSSASAYEMIASLPQMQIQVRI